MNTHEAIKALESTVAGLERRLRDQIKRMERQRERLAVSRAAPDRARPLPAVRVGRLAGMAHSSVVAAGTVLYPGSKTTEPSGAGWRTAYECPVTGWRVGAVSVVESESVLGLRDAAGAAITRRALRVLFVRKTAIETPTSPHMFLGGPCGYRLYAALTRYSRAVLMRDPGGSLRAGHMRAMGLTVEEALVPPHPSVPWELSLLRELMFFPEKFLFVEVAGLPSGVTEAELFVLLSEGVPDLKSVAPDDLVTDATVVANLESRVYPLNAVAAEMTRAEISAPDRAVYSVDGLLEFDQEQRAHAAIPHASAANAQAGWRYWRSDNAREAGKDRGVQTGPSAVVVFPPARDAGAFRTLTVRYTAMGWGCAPPTESVTEDGGVRCDLVEGPEAGPLAPASVGLASWYVHLRRLVFGQGVCDRMPLGDLLRAEAMLDAHTPERCRSREKRRRALAESIVSAVHGATTKPAVVCGDGHGEPERIMHGREMRVCLDPTKFPEGRVELHAAVIARLLSSIAPLGTFTRLIISTGADQEEITWLSR